jgi:hypothetical protein
MVELHILRTGTIMSLPQYCICFQNSFSYCIRWNLKLWTFSIRITPWNDSKILIWKQINRLFAWEKNNYMIKLVLRIRIHFFRIRTRIHNFFFGFEYGFGSIDSYIRPQIFPNCASNCFHMCSGTCTSEKKIFQ